MAAASKIVQAAIEVLAKKSGGALDSVPLKTLPTDEASRMARGYSGEANTTLAISRQMPDDQATKLIKSRIGQITRDAKLRGAPPSGPYAIEIGALRNRLREIKDLPTDTSRAGFDSQTYYHYSEAPNIEKFDPKAPDSWGQTDDRGASYFTSDPDYAEKLMLEKAEAKDFTDYKSIEEYLDILSGSDLAATTYPVKIKTDKIFDYNDENAVDDLIDSFGKYMGREFGDNAESLLRSGDWSILEMPALQEALKDAGYRGYKTSEPGTVGLFYPDKGDVRSIFAKFDPAKSESGEILASVPAIATGLAGYGALSNVVEENNGQRSN
jgi:hypothetical protein